MPEALAALRRAVDHDPDDLSVYADIAGTLADNGRLDEALQLDRPGAGHATRRSTARCTPRTGCGTGADGDLAHLVRLADFIRDHPDDTHEHTDLAECCRGRALAEPACRPRRAAAAGPARAPVVRRAPVRGRGAAAAPGRRRCPGRTRRPRTTPRSAWSWSSRGSAGPDRSPPPPRTRGRPGAGRTTTGRCGRRAQIWACLGLLHHRTDEPWLDSARRRLLLDLLDGGVDRVTEAALFALVTSAWVDPPARSRRGRRGGTAPAGRGRRAAGARRLVGGRAGAGHPGPGPGRPAAGRGDRARGGRPCRAGIPRQRPLLRSRPPAALAAGR